MKRNKHNIDEIKHAKMRYKEYKKGQSANKFVVIGLVLLLVAVIAAGVYFCFHEPNQSEQADISDGDLVIEKVTDSEEIIESTEETITDDNVETEEAFETDEMTDEEIEAVVDAYLANMNIEAKVGQLFFTTPEELTGIGIAVQAGETTKTKMKEYGVGGIIFTDQNFEVLDQMKLMVSNMKIYSTYPIFMAIDEAGALRITNTKNTIDEAGFNMASIDSELYLLTDDGNVIVSEELNVVNLSDGDILDLVQTDADIIMAESEFQNTYETLVTAVRNGTVDEEIINEKVRRIMTYKVANGI